MSRCTVIKSLHFIPCSILITYLSLSLKTTALLHLISCYASFTGIVHSYHKPAFFQLPAGEWLLLVWLKSDWTLLRSSPLSLWFSLSFNKFIQHKSHFANMVTIRAKEEVKAEFALPCDWQINSQQVCSVTWLYLTCACDVWFKNAMMEELVGSWLVQSPILGSRSSSKLD